MMQGTWNIETMPKLGRGCAACLAFEGCRWTATHGADLVRGGKMLVMVPLPT